MPAGEEILRKALTARGRIATVEKPKAVVMTKSAITKKHMIMKYG